MNNQLFVWLYAAGARTPIPCGELELLGGRRCLFQYLPAYLARSNAFALAPDLPLRRGWLEPSAGQDLHPIFEDAGPDRWGRQIIEKIFQPQRRSPIDYLALAGEDRIGALGFSQSEAVYQVSQQQVWGCADLAELLQAAYAVECQLPLSAHLRQLLQPGASAGGARPKAILQEGGRKWLAKFPANGDECDVCALEYASLQLAAGCGIAVPAAKLISVNGKNVLLVERFDRASDGSRYHFASARTLLLAQGIKEGQMAYADIAEVARRFSVRPQADCLQIFLRMAFNVFMENTDDHEKNHAFLYQDGHWSLAPAYDLQPQLQAVRYQQLIVGAGSHEPTLSNLMADCGRFMLTPAEASAALKQLAAKLACWPQVFARYHVPENQIELCQRFILAEQIAALCE
ncbi:HipA protein [Mycoavidus cysteinexigens]|uniref:HipA protein n=1 Tax=Mycoavidus cysteinexigens TaxID=1553431 RepID=A0A2Z6EU71_9BURK|nr:type II toxin-antitoxin system HipA family toxin [Mycoavidus cysteinexigens]BBE08966.1 HipA protein [Mycoavidus cysteinexigens]GAM52311.1 hypothetical protein EBME_0774 [bacterium endosymbiont of Mortierella elongata FMR23-6]GLR01189.1 phosphatidylinositol kinase [Mycoavidus cysteinexigens]